MTNYEPKDIELADVLKRAAILSGWTVVTPTRPAYFTARRGDDSIAVRVSNGELDMSKTTTLRNIDPLHAVDLMLDKTEENDDDQR